MVWFWVERSKVNVRVRVNSAIRRGFGLYECLLFCKNNVNIAFTDRCNVFTFVGWFVFSVNKIAEKLWTDSHET